MPLFLIGAEIQVRMFFSVERAEKVAMIGVKMEVKA